MTNGQVKNITKFYRMLRQLENWREIQKDKCSSEKQKALTCTGSPSSISEDDISVLVDKDLNKDCEYYICIQDHYVKII